MLTAMKGLLFATVFLPVFLSLNVAFPAFSQDVPKPAAPPPTIVQQVRAALDNNDVASAEKLVLGEIADTGTTPIVIEAYSWLGRGLLAQKRYDEAMASALRTYTIIEEQLKTRGLDDEPRLPTALGASIEVQAQVMAAQGARSDAILFLRKEIERYKNSSMIARLTKNVNLIGLEGQPAFAINATDWFTTQKPAMADLKGKPVVLWLWAHWCSDCKIFGPILDAARKKYQGSGLTVVAATQPFGYVAKKKPAGWDEERAYALQVRDEYYPWLKDVPMPVSADLYSAYGVSTSPTLVFIDRAGNVANYHPGRLTAEELDAVLATLVSSSSAPRKD
jgi:thiol-disulfide isomerase/thioredoxin